MPSLVLLTETPDRHICPLGRATLMVGSGDQSDLHLPSATISNDHASIIFEDEEFILRDNGSMSGSFVNGSPITRCILKHQDLIRFGEYLFMVDLQDQVVDDDIFTKQINPTSDVTVSPAKEEKRGSTYSTVVNITQPDALKRQTQNLRDKRTSQNIRLLLTEPVPYTPRSKPGVAGGGGVKYESTYRAGSSKGTLLTILLMVPITMIITFLGTLFVMPLTARDALVHSEGFKDFPFSGLISSMVLQSGSKQTEVVSLRPGVSYGTKMTLSRETLIVGRLMLGLKPSRELNLHLSLETDDKTPTVLLEKDLQIKPGSIQEEMFSIVLPAGVYNFECTWDIPLSEIYNNNQESGDEIMRKREIPATIELKSWL